MALAQLSDCCEAEVDSQLCGVGRGHKFSPRWSSLCSCPLRTGSMSTVGTESDPEQRFVIILGQKCFALAAAQTSTASSCEGRRGHSHWVLLVPKEVGAEPAVGLQSRAVFPPQETLFKVPTGHERDCARVRDAMVCFCLIQLLALDTERDHNQAHPVLPRGSLGSSHGSWLESDLQESFHLRQRALLLLSPSHIPSGGCGCCRPVRDSVGPR